MRVPRVKEFDPNATEPVLKSSFDHLPAIQKSQPGNDAKVKPGLSPHTQKATTDQRAVKTRHPFDIYLDQYEALAEFSSEEKRNGKRGSMSAMVRDALDLYITSKRKK
jgi:hypothetical protein